MPSLNHVPKCSHIVRGVEIPAPARYKTKCCNRCRRIGLVQPDFKDGVDDAQDRQDVLDVERFGTSIPLPLGHPPVLSRPVCSLAAACMPTSCFPLLVVCKLWLLTLSIGRTCRGASCRPTQRRRGKERTSDSSWCTEHHLSTHLSCRLLFGMLVTCMFNQPLTVLRGRPTPAGKGLSSDLEQFRRATPAVPKLPPIPGRPVDSVHFVTP